MCILEQKQLYDKQYGKRSKPSREVRKHSVFENNNAENKQHLLMVFLLLK